MPISPLLIAFLTYLRFIAYFVVIQFFASTLCFKQSRVYLSTTLTATKILTFIHTCTHIWGRHIYTFIAMNTVISQLAAALALTTVFASHEVRQCACAHSRWFRNIFFENPYSNNVISKQWQQRCLIPKSEDHMQCTSVDACVRFSKALSAASNYVVHVHQ